MKKKSRLRFKPDELPENAAPKEEVPKASQKEEATKAPQKNKQEKSKKPDKTSGKAGKGKTSESKKKTEAPKPEGKAVPKEKAAPPTSLHFEENRPKAPSKLIHHVEQTARLETHQLLRQENEDENVAAEAAESGQEVTESALRAGSRVEKQIREHRRSPNRKDAPHQSVAQQAEIKNNPQKQLIKKQYARAKTQSAGESKPVILTAKDYAEKAVEKVKSGVAYFRRNPKGAAVALALFIMLSMLTNIVSSCSVILEGISSGIAGSTYPSADADMLAAEAEYCAMEAQLQRRLDNYEDDHEYNEYYFELDSIGHDPYVLISTLTALHDGAWTIDEVRGTLWMLFEKQYTLTENVHTVYIRNPDDPEAEPEPYSYAYVKLKNNDLSHLPCEIMTDAQLSRYSVYMATLGNRPDLFPGSVYIGRYGEGNYITYEIPPSALEDEAFAAMIAEAEKYLGYP